MVIFYQILFLILTYLLAAIPFGLLFARYFAKTDIRQYGSKNIGATNVYRVAGKKLGLLTLICDSLKGALMVIAARFCFQDAEFLHIYLILVASTAILAHIFPIYLNFRGGKGVATSLAVLIALDLPIGLIAIFVWLATFGITRISSISSIASIFSSLIACLIFDTAISQKIFLVILSVLITFRHRENIARLKEGKEK